MTLAVKESNPTRPLAYGLAAFAVACGAATIALAILNGPRLSDPESAKPVELTIAFTYGLSGGLLAARLPRNPLGWVFLVIGVTQGMSGVAGEYALFGLAPPIVRLPGFEWATWFDNWISAVVYPTGAAAIGFALLPDGRLPSRRWRSVIAVGVAYSAIFIILTVLAPGPIQPSLGPAAGSIDNPTGQRFLDALNTNPNSLNPLGFGYLVGLLVLVTCAAAPMVRLRRARGDARLQIKLIAYVIITTTIANILSVVASLVVPAAFQSSLFWLIPIGLGYGVALPVSVGIAIFKYRLYDIDIVINRTLVYGALAVCITAVYVGIAVGIGALVGSGGKPNLPLSILATAIVSIGFQPLRSRLQRVANRLVYGKRATPYEVLSDFSSRVSEAYAGHDLLQRMATLLGEATGAETAEVWLRTGDHLRRDAVFPASVAPRDVVSFNGAVVPAIEGATVAVPVRHNDELLGVLAVKKKRNEDLTAVERKLVDDLAHQAGLVLRNVGLTAELEARLEDLRASRQRLVAAQDTERRRLERNLHDGAQQHLVALKVKLGLAGMTARKNPEQAAAAIEQLQHDADEALETLRDLARGIYPPLLADKGLHAALDAQSRKATLPVSVDADGIGRYPQDVEAALYFCCLEALQNVQKYAHATQAVVRLRDEGGSVRVEVEDDGGGFDAAAVKRGAGLTNMEDRIDALGGTLEVESVVGRGTRLRASLPASRLS